MTKQQKIQRLERNNYTVTFFMSGGVMIYKNQLNRNIYNSINQAYNKIFK